MNPLALNKAFDGVGAGAVSLSWATVCARGSHWEPTSADGVCVGDEPASGDGMHDSCGPVAVAKHA